MSDTQTPSELPVLRELREPANGAIPSRGFRNSLQRRRHELIEELTDTRTAMMLYALVNEGEFSNYDETVKAAIRALYRDKQRSPEFHWRYYCRGCDFPGGPSNTHAEAEAGSQAHAEVCEDPDMVVFPYQPDEWDDDDAAELAGRYTE